MRGMDQLGLSNGMLIVPEMSHPDYYETTPTNVFSMEKTDLSHLNFSQVLFLTRMIYLNETMKNSGLARV